MRNAGIPLFCLPYAGGAAALFHRWAGDMPPDVAVRPVELPGHGARHAEPLIGEMGALVELVAREAERQIDGAYALFGHSFGALVAFEVARVLSTRVGEPAALFVSGHNAPSRRTHRGIHALPDEELLRATEIWGGMPPELVRYPTLQARLLRVLRVDLRLADTYRRTPGGPLSCPITVFGGESDALVDRAGLADWRLETTGTTKVVMVHGGHLYVHDQSFPQVLREHIAVCNSWANSGRLRHGSV